MQLDRRGIFLTVIQVVAFSALFGLFVFPQSASAHAGIGPDTHSTITTQQQANPVSVGLFDKLEHCHLGLDCSIQAVFLSGYEAGFMVADFRLSFRSAGPKMASHPVSFDPPPPRVLS